MGYSDPQSITYDSNAVSLPRTGQGVDQGQFTSADGTKVLKVSNLYGSRTRRTVRLDMRKIAPSTTNPSTNVNVSWSAYIVIDVPRSNVDSAEQIDTIKALTEWLSADDYAATVKMVGGES